MKPIKANRTKLDWTAEKDDFKIKRERNTDQNSDDFTKYLVFDKKLKLKERSQQRLPSALL